jgi:xanthosine utilization system XapX-like protein
MEHINTLVTFFGSASPELLVALVALAGMLVVFQSLRVVFRLIDREREK